MSLEVNNDAATIHSVGGFCWLCGRSPGFKPKWFYAPYYLQVAHIASGGGRAYRVDDRRAVGLLCSLCHLLHVSDSSRQSTMLIGNRRFPTIDERHTLYLKQFFDPEFYDTEWLARIWVGNLPEPTKPDVYWTSQVYKHTGILL